MLDYLRCVSVQRFLCVCVFGCDVFMCVVGMHVASVCAQLEVWKPCVSWRGDCSVSARVCVRARGSLENPGDPVLVFVLIGVCGVGGVAPGLGRGRSRGRYQGKVDGWLDMPGLSQPTHRCARSPAGAKCVSLPGCSKERRGGRRT